MSMAACTRQRQRALLNGSANNANTASSVSTATPAATTSTSLTLKLGAAGNAKKNVRGKRPGNSVTSSESSDPVESDYSQETEEDVDDVIIVDDDDDDAIIVEDTDDEYNAAQLLKRKKQKQQQQQLKQQPQSKQLCVDDTDESEHSEDADDEGDEDVDASSDDDDKHRNDKGDRATDSDNDDSDDVDQDDDEEEDDDDEGSDDDAADEDETDDSSSVETAKGVRKYHLDDFQMIKTVGTGTFGRVFLCRDRMTEKYCAMKILTMTDVIRLKQIEHVKNERNILREIRHPFVVSLEWSTKDDCCLYMIFEYVCGGELFTYLRNEGRFNSATSNFYAAEIVSALEYLHSLQIVYRDLKPENLLINRDGHLKITDFGFAKKLRDRTWTLCGTPEYLAPEIIQSKGHNKAVDWWALGVLIYEMLAGYPPFYDDNPFGIYEKILSGKVEWPRHMDPVAKDLVKKFLVNDRTKRLGNMKNGTEDVKRHRWFKHLNWNDVYNKKMKPPRVPHVSFDGDTSNFDEYPEKDWKPATAVEQDDLNLFKDF